MTSPPGPTPPPQSPEESSGPLDAEEPKRPADLSDRRALAVSVLAGLEAGVLGGLGLLAWEGLASRVMGDPFWWRSAILASAAFGPVVSTGSFALAGLVGAALQILGCGLVGLVFGICVRRSWATRRVMLFGILLGLSWYYVEYEILIRRFGLGVYDFGPRRSVLSAHMLFGLLLAAYPQFAASLEGTARSGG